MCSVFVVRAPAVPHGVESGELRSERLGLQALTLKCGDRVSGVGRSEHLASTSVKGQGCSPEVT